MVGAPTGPAFPQSQPVRPSAWWYALVAPIIVVGIVIAVFQAIDEARRIEDAFVRIGSDGTGSVTVEAGEEQTVWAVWTDDRPSEDLQRPEATVRITGPDGDDVDFRAASASSRFTISTGSFSAIDLGRFTPDADGAYDVEVTYAEDIGDVRDTGVGSLGLLEAFTRVLGTIGIAILAAIGWVVLLSIMRMRSRRRSRAATTTLPGAPPQGPITFG